MALEGTVLRRPAAPASKRLLTRAEPYLYMLPAILFVGVFLLYPAAFTLYASFTRWDGLNPPEFIGLQNYIQLVRESVFVTSSINTVVWVIATLIFPVLLGLVQ